MTIEASASASSMAVSVSAGPWHSGPSHTLTALRGQTPLQPTLRADTLGRVLACRKSVPAPLRQQRAPVQIVTVGGEVVAKIIAMKRSIGGVELALTKSWIQHDTKAMPIGWRRPCRYNRRCE